MNTRHQRGIMLIELMVGLFIGLLTTLAIVQTLVFMEKQRRTTLSGSDVQTTGALALNALQRDLRQAGYGLIANPDALGCPVSGGTSAFTLAPVIITAAGDSAGSSQLEIFSSSKNGAAVPELITENHTSGTQFVVRSSLSIYVDTSDSSKNDRMVAVPQTWSSTLPCKEFAVASKTATSTASTVVATAAVTATFAAQSYLVNLGNALNYRKYAISDNVLQTFGTLGSTTPIDAFANIVNMQALYGKDTNADGVVDSYDTTTPTTNAGWKQVLTVRIALVTRSPEYEKEVVSTVAPQWDLGSAVTVSGASACSSGSGGSCLSLKVSHLTDWAHYRFRIFDTQIPLRNVLWNS